MSGISMVWVTCGTCGAEVDRVEYDTDGVSSAVTQVVDALGLSLDEATAMVAEHNPGAELDSKSRAHALADQIIQGKVEGRQSDTCPNGHAGNLTVSDTRPAPLSSTAIAVAVAADSGDGAHAAPITSSNEAGDA